MQLTNHKFITHSYSHAFPAEFALNLLREVASRREEGSVVMPSNTGRLGARICELLLLSIVTTAYMVGLSLGDCCTQRRPICTHLSSSNRSSGSGWATAESRSSAILWSFQDSHACKALNKCVMLVPEMKNAISVKTP